MVTEIGSVIQVWRQHCMNLYKEVEPEQQPESSLSIKDMQQEPDILRSEVEYAIRHLKNNKSRGEDDINAEMLKHLPAKGIDLLWKICNRVWQTGQWPIDWCTSTLIPLHKKGSSKKCNHYRTDFSSKQGHAQDPVAENFLEWQIPQEQTGFVRGKGTRDQIMNVRQIIEKTREYDKTAYLCFLDYSKAFDCVNWRRL